jgi:hypothetical protein
MKTENDIPHPDDGEKPGDIGRKDRRKVVVRRREIKA